MKMPADSTTDYRSRREHSGLGWFRFAALPILVMAVLMPVSSTRVGGDVVVAKQIAVPFGGGTSMSADVSLETDPDLESWLRRAAQYAQEERYRDAAILMQDTIDKSIKKSAMISKDGKVFVPVRIAVEQTLLKLPKPVLETYRELTEGEARGLMNRATGDNEEKALNEIVRRFFLTSYGDDAAFRLGCLLLDRYDFVGARRYLHQALEEHPDPSVDKAEVWLRLAVVAARLGDAKAAEKYGAQVSKSKRADEFQWAMDRLPEEIKASGSWGGDTALSVGEWRMDLGDPTRRGLMTPLPERSFDDSAGAWTVLWQPPTVGLAAPEWTSVRVQVSSSNKKKPATRGDLLKRWKQQKWTPVGQIRFSGDQVFFKTHHFRNSRGQVVPALVAVDAHNGKIAWVREDRQPKLGGAQRIYVYHSHYNARSMPNYPVTPEEVLMFGDTIGQAMSLSHGNVYTIEGQAWRSSLGQRVNIMRGGRYTPANFGNRLVAVEAKTGKLKWVLRGDEADKGDSEIKSFLAAPVAVGGSLVVPMTENGGLHLMGIDPTTGDELWKRFLCADGSVMVNEWATIGVAADGSDVYVATGRGLVFSVSAVDGEIRWASHYDRDVKNQRYYQRYYNPSYINGWKQDTVVPVGGLLAVMPSDAQYVFAFDRRTGEMVGKRRDTDGQYCLGATSDGVVTAGGGHLRRYRLRRGNVDQIWDRSIGDSLGRGVLTNDAIYIPEGQSIIRRTIAKGDVAGEVKIARMGSSNSSDPVGNIYSSGEQLYVHGLERTYAMVDAERRVALLEKRIQAGDPDALETRARLSIEQGKHLFAANDLRLAVKNTTDRYQKSKLQSLLLSVLLELAKQNPKDAGDYLQEAGQLAATESDRTKIALRQASLMAKAGKHKEALIHFLTVARDTSGTLMEVSGGRDKGLKVMARYIAMEEVRDLLEVHPKLADLIEAEAHKALEEVDKQNDPDKLVSVWRAFPKTPSGIKAMTAAAHLETKRGNLEKAELILRDGIESRHSLTVANALATLAQLHDEKGFDMQAAWEWKQLATWHGNIELENAKGEKTTAAVLAAEQMTALKDAIDQPLRRMPAGPWKQLWSFSGSPTYMLPTAGLNESEFLSSHVIMLSQAHSRLVCMPTNADSARWQRSLSGSSNSRLINASRVRIYNGTKYTYHDGTVMRDGHIGFSLSDTELVAYGLINGKTLWRAPCPGVLDVSEASRTPYYGSSSQEGQGISSISAGRGVVAVHRRDGSNLADRVEVFDSRTGRQRWTRNFQDAEVKGVWIGGGYVNVMFDKEKGACFDVDTGRLAGEFKLNGHLQYSPLVWTDDGVMYADARGLNFINLPSGKLTWSQGLTGRPHRIGMLNDSLVYVIPQNLEITVIDVRTGKLRMKDRPVEFSNGAQDCAISRDGQIHVIGMNSQSHMMLLVADKFGRRQHMVNLGKGVLNRVEAEAAATEGDLVPMVQQERSNQWQVHVFSKKARSEVKDGVLPGPRSGDKFYGVFAAPMVRGETVIISSSDGVHAYVHDEKNDKSGKDDKK